MIDSGTAQGIITILFLIGFVGLSLMVFRPSKKTLYEENGRIPLENPKSDFESSEIDKH
jgi:cbb3-type cytochrome oxidase subunit 3